MNPASERLYEDAVALLEASALALEDSLAGPPDYQAVTQYLPVFDCPPALYVTLGAVQVAPTDAGPGALATEQRMVTTGSVYLATLVVTIIRCIVVPEQGQNPSAFDVAEDARICYSDLWSIWNGLKNQHRAGTLFQTASQRREFALDPAIPVRSSGGVGGWMIQVRVQEPGYPA